MHRRSRSLAVLAVLLAGGTAHAETSAYCERVSKKPETRSGYEVVTIDANSGQVVDGTTRLAEDARVQFIFSGKNPFRYEYRFPVTSQPLGAAVALRFLQMIPGLDLGSLPSATAKAKDIKGLASSKCTTPEDLEWVKEVEKRAKALQQRSVQVRDNLGYFEEANSFLKATETDVLQDLPLICGRAEQLRAWPHAPGSFTKDTDTFKTQSEEWAAFLGKDEGLNGKSLSVGCQDETEKATPTFEEEADAYQKAAAKVEAELQTHKVAIQQLDSVLASTLTREDPFFETRYTSPRDEPTGVRAEVFRRDLRTENAPERLVGTVNLELGRSPFSLSAGIVFSTIDSRRLVRQSSRVPTEDNPNQVGLRFGYDEDSDFTFAPAVFLNARLTDNPRYNWGASAGIVTAAADSTLRIDYALGLFASFRDVFYLHLGLQAGQRSSLAGGFQEGEEVPADLPDPIPTTKDWKVGFLLGFSLQLN
ncbi:hypothetical protein EJ065_0721 [Corallococcus coralloides]|uniref:Uncharacterized protein n=1 Tax=Corallococcus coralloides TaxID=184914 RepID=A0A410RKC5_CORCK|nr:hypothetical protein [Corallococcus coralloides]QAT82326.1 hypothetical protein EJ065_0721 [Corallococcus coralloides]